MNRSVFTYLKRRGLTDVRMVNKLFVSAFMRHYNLVPRVNALLMSVYIQEESDEYSLLYELIRALDKSECEYTIEDLTKLFEFVISPEDRKVSGAVYTPKYIRQCIVDEVFANYDLDISEVHVADIACGCGGFLLTVAEFIHQRTNKPYADIVRENIYGIDLQNYSVERTKLLLALQAFMNGEDVNLSYNLWKGNSLDFDFSVMDEVDIVVGNPPYVCARNMNAESRELIKHWEVCRSGNSDLYIPFFQIAIELLRDGGRLGYITMNSFLRSVNGRKLREYFASNSYDISIIDFRGYQIFLSKSTYTCLFYLQKGRISNGIRYVTCENGDLPKCNDFMSIKYSLLNHKKGWALNDFENTLAQEMIGVPLGKLCKSRHGIATLCNKVYIFRPSREDDSYYYILDNKQYVKIEKGICRDIVNSNKLNSAVEFDSVIEKVIYPYQKLADGHVGILPEDKFLRLYPFAYKYLQSHREELNKRDKGNLSKYPAWYAYGRTQSLQMPRYKLFFPKFANKRLQTILVDNPNILLYNGVAFVSDSMVQLQTVKRVLESNDFWQYIVRNAKPYANDYYSVCGADILNYGVIV